MRDDHPSLARAAGKPTNEKEIVEMGDQAPCVNATHYETFHHQHMTRNDSGVCDRCNQIMDYFQSRTALNDPEPVEEPV